MAIAFTNLKQLVSISTFIFAISGSSLLMGASQASTSPSCTQVLARYKLGPALTVAEVEAISLKKMKSTPTAPQIPFGYTNKQWIALKSLMQPGDTLHEFSADVTGGYLVVRKGCKIGQITTWVI
jgi:hypothetical protein